MLISRPTRSMTPKTTDARPCRPIAQRHFLTCVPATFVNRSDPDSILLPPGLRLICTTSGARPGCHVAATGTPLICRPTHGRHHDQLDRRHELMGAREHARLEPA